MKKFMVHYLAPAEAMAKMANATEEQKAEGMKPWMEWKAQIGNKLVDFGAPMIGASRLNPDGTESQNTSEITGYSIIQADNLEEAKSILKSHPHLQWTDKVAIEVFECFEM